MLRDDEIYPVFRDAVQSVEPALAAAIERVRKEVDAATADRLSDALRQVFGRVLKELADLDNPMRTLLGDEPGDGAVDSLSRRPVTAHPAAATAANPPRRRSRRARTPTARAGTVRLRQRRRLAERPPTSPAVRRSRSSAARRRSRFDADTGTVLYNDQHADFLLVKTDEAALLDYLATLVAKEYVVYNNPRADADDLAEELVRMLIRVRRRISLTRRRR